MENVSKNQYNAALATRYTSPERHQNPLQILAYEAWLREVGDVRGKYIRDMGCGAGDSTRLLAELHPRRLEGFDYSEEMLSLARSAEVSTPVGISYIQADCSQVLPDGGRPCECATSMWLYHYAQSEHMLLGFARSTFATLASSGRVVALTQNKPASVIRRPGFGELGEWLDTPEQNGSRQRIILLDAAENEIASFIIYYWTTQTYLRIFAEAGFREVEFKQMHFNEETRSLFTQWKEMEDSAGCSILTAYKP